MKVELLPKDQIPASNYIRTADNLGTPIRNDYAIPVEEKVKKDMPKAAPVGAIKTKSYKPEVKITTIGNGDNFYENVKSLIDAGVYNINVASHMIASEIKHRCIVAGKYKDDLGHLDFDLLDENVFKFIEQLIYYHIEGYIRYSTINASIRNYYNIKPSVVAIAERANEYYDLDIKTEVLEEEIDNMYKSIK